MCTKQQRNNVRAIMRKYNALHIFTNNNKHCYSIKAFFGFNVNANCNAQQQQQNMQQCIAELQKQYSNAKVYTTCTYKSALYLRSAQQHNSVTIRIAK